MTVISAYIDLFIQGKCPGGNVLGELSKHHILYACMYDCVYVCMSMNMYNFYLEMPLNKRLYYITQGKRKCMFS